MITDERLFPSFDFETGDVPLKQSLQPRVNRREGRPETKSRPKPRRKHPANKGPPPNRILKRPMDESQYRSLFQSEGAPSELQARRGAEASWTGRSSETQRPGELGLLRKLLNLQETESRTTTVRSPYVKKSEIRYTESISLCISLCIYLFHDRYCLASFSKQHLTVSLNLFSFGLRSGFS